MRHRKKAAVRILSLILAVVMLMGVFPVTAMAEIIDAPLTGETGNGWDNLGGDPSESSVPDVVADSGDLEQPTDEDNNHSNQPNNSNNDTGAGNSVVDADNMNSVDDSDLGPPEAVVATPAVTSLGVSGINIDLPPDVLADFIAFMEHVEEAARYVGIMPMAAPGDTGAITWSWGETANFNAGGYYCNQIPKLNLVTSNPPEGRPFCAQFGPDPLQGGTYTATAFNNNTILKLLIAHKEGKATAVGTQLAIWSITNTSAFASHPEAQSALSAANSVSTNGYTLLRWTASGSYQPFFTLERDDLPTSGLKILKKSTSGKLLPGAEFSVVGPGVNKTGLLTNNKGEISVDIPSPGGTYTVTETTPPDGYLPATPDSQTVTINATTPSGTVVFENEPEDPDKEEKEASSFRVEVEVEVETNVEVHNEKEFNYSDAIGQVTIRKHDQDGKSLDGALFNILVEFTNGESIFVENWEVDNGARLFTWTHPDNNHDPAKVTVWEVQPPQHYRGDTAPKTVQVRPTYTRVTIVTEWTQTMWTYFYRYTVIEIKPGGDEVEVDSWTESRDEFEVTSPIIESFPDFIAGDRETTVTFINTRITGELIVTKRDANTGQPLAGAQVHVWGQDLGNAGTYDRTETTGADGTAVFTGLFPGTYAIQETLPPYGYNLNDQVQTAVIQSNETVHKEIQNTRKAGLFIKKVDENGKPIPGATFELRRGSGEVLMREVTDQNGIVFRGYLTTDTYVVEEIKAPEGYLIDENPIQSIYIPNTDDNKEFVLTFVNKKKPAIEIEKVDGKTPTLKLEGAIFRITDTRTGIYWDIQTKEDGKALLEDLEINTTYMVEEIEAPAGYVNSGYRQEIVLKEARVHTLTISNELKPSLKIIKKDAETGGRLSGAIFRLAKEGSVNYQDVTTGIYGEILITDIAPGTYTLTEIKAPNGYVLDNTPKTIIVVQGEHTVIELMNHQKPSLKLIKKDALSGSVLEGAIFRLAKEGSIDYKDVTTAKDGSVLISELDPGTYILTEIKAPNGYLIDDSPMTVIISEGEHKIIELVNYKKPSLEIVKKDKETGELLEGATFRVSWNNGADYRDVTTKANGKALVTDLNSGWYSVTELNAPEGYLLNTESQQILLNPGEVGIVEVFNEAKPSLTLLKIDNVTKTPLQYAKFRIEMKADDSTKLIGEYVSDEDGIVFLDNILPGRYLITEIEAPAGYNIDSVTHEVTIEFGRTYKLEITNTPKSPIYIQKVDEKGNPLYGAEFKVTTMNGSMVGTVKTGITGYAIIPYALPGWYVVEEVKAPDGYVISDAPVNVELLSGRPAQVSFVNFKKPIMQIMKLDAEDGKPLIGAKFKITEANGKSVGEYTTDANGTVLLDSLNPGTYIIAETKAPDGYILDMTPQTVVLEAGKAVRVEFYNVSKPGLQLTKLDKVTGLPVKGAMFNVVELQGTAKKDLGSFTTSENGTFFIPNLTPGHYVITEIKAATGYILDSTPRNIYVEGGKLNTVEVYNTPYSDLRLLKIDSETREPLEGAIFKLFDEKRLEIGTYTTSTLGEIYLTGLPSGSYFLQEVKAPAGYLLDNTVKQIELLGGKTTTVEWKNTALGSVRIVKVDAETQKPLYGVKFELYNSSGASLGQFSTDQNGVISLSRNLQPGRYKIKEIVAPAGYFLDNKVYDIIVTNGETTELVIENTKLASLRIVKEDAKTGKKLPLASFLLYDAKMNLIGEYTTNDKGEIFIPNAFASGTYKLKEIKAPSGYVLDDQIRTVELRIGTTTEILVENDLMVGNIQIVKVSDGKNSLTGHKKGDPLKGATFQVFNEALDIVDEITTDANGIAKTIDLPLGKYVIKESQAPKYYLTNGDPIYAEIKVHGDLIRITVENTPEELEVDVTKRGVMETMAGELNNYEFSDIANNSNTKLNDFYWRDTLPTDAVRIQSLNTGTWSERGTYDVWVKTNLKDWKRIKTGLHTNVEYTVDMRPTALGLASNEYVTEYKLIFGTVDVGFKSEKNPFISVRVNNGLAMGYRFVNQTDVGGKVGNEWVYDRDSWISVIYRPNRKLPKTGGPT